MSHRLENRVPKRMLVLFSEDKCTLEKVHQWLLSNKLTLNNEKTEYMIIESKQRLTNITITIQKLSSEKLRLNA